MCTGEKKIIKANNCNKLIIEVNYWLAPCKKTSVNVHTYNLYFFRDLHKIFVRESNFSCRYLLLFEKKTNIKLLFFFGRKTLIFWFTILTMSDYVRMKVK